MTSNGAQSQRLQDLIRGSKATVGVMGMGYVGLPLALTAAAKGFSVIGFDVDAPRVEHLNNGGSPLAHIDAARVKAARDGGRFEASAAFERLAEADVVLICVPTPLGPNRDPDLQFVVQTAEAISANLRPGQLIVLESTTYPGTTAEVVAPILERSGLKLGVDVFLAYSAEREDPGNPNFETGTIPKVVGADDEDSLNLAYDFYSLFITSVHKVSSSATAEAVKLTENIFRSVNIALVNELKVIFDAMDIDVFEVVRAAATKPFGYMPFYPGPGLGGHCIPIDPFYLSWRARAFGLNARFIELAGEVNTSMPKRVVERTALAVDQVHGRGLTKAKILIIGIAYKPDVDDMRESPALEIMELLEARGAHVEFHDPMVPVIPMTREHAKLAGRKSVPLTAQTAADCDAALIVTQHKAVDWDLLFSSAKAVVDTRDMANLHQAAATKTRVFTA